MMDMSILMQAAKHGKKSDYCIIMNSTRKNLLR